MLCAVSSEGIGQTIDDRTGFVGRPSGDNACRCGCGTEAIPDRLDDAVLLRNGQRSADELRKKLHSGGARRSKAQDLLWAWERAELPLIA